MFVPIDSSPSLTTRPSARAYLRAVWVALLLCSGCGRIGYEALRGDVDASVSGSVEPWQDASPGASLPSEQSGVASDASVTGRDATSETTPDGTTSDGTTRDGTISDGTISDGTTSDRTTSDALTRELPSDSSLDASVPTSDSTGADSSVGGGATTASDVPESSSEVADTSGGQSVSASASDTASGSAENSTLCENTTLGCGGECAPCPCSWGTPEMLGDPNYVDNGLYSPTLSADGLTLWFGLIVSGGPEQAAYATRATTNVPFGQGMLAPAPVASNGWDGNPHISYNQLSLYFYSARNNNDLGIFQATRATTNVQFDQVVELTSINGSAVEQLPWVSADERTIYFVSDRSGSRDIWMATRAQATEAFSPPTPVVELNTDGDDAKVTLSPDGLVAIFASERAGGLGGLDLYRAARATTALPFEAPTLINELSTGQLDYDPELTRNGDMLYFGSNRSGQSAIWRASLTCQ